MLFKQVALWVLLFVFSNAGFTAPLADGIEAYRQGKYSNAFDRLMPLAKQGEGVAAYYVGMMYIDGLGVMQNNAKALRWLERAVDYHHRDAAVMLGKMYMSGMGVPLDHNKAAYFLGLAEKLREPEDVDDCD